VQDDRIEVDLVDPVAVLFRETGERRHQSRERFDVPPFEQALRAQACDQFHRVLARKRQRRERRIAKNLGMDAAEPEHQHRTERRIALHAGDEENDLWILDTVSETLTRVTFDRGLDSYEAWTPDGKRLAYVSGHSGELNLYWRLADGTGQAEALLREPPKNNSGALVINGFTPDGKWLLYSSGVPSDIMALPIEGSRTPKPVLTNTQYAERSASISPDGRFIAYQSDESGAFQVYVRPFPDVDQGRWQISSSGGTLPLWAPTGKELVFSDSENRIISVPVTTQPTFAFGRPVPLVNFSDRPASVYRNYDFAPDGSRLVLVKDPSRSRGSTQFVVTLNWFDELRRRLPHN